MTYSVTSKKKLILPKKLSYFCIKLDIVDVFTVWQYIA